MCNCGNKRNEYFGEAITNELDNRVSEEVIPREQRRKDAYFEYIGKTALTVVGINTGNYYRFYSPGEVQLIHYDDVEGMMNVGVLNMVRE
jgi:hypothetical protein